MPCLILTLEWEIGKDIYLWRFADWNLCFLFRNATLRWSPLQYALSLRHRFPLITCGSLSNLVINFLSWLIMSWLSWCMFCKFSLFSLFTDALHCRMLDSLGLEIWDHEWQIIWSKLDSDSQFMTCIVSNIFLILSCSFFFRVLKIVPVRML